MRSLRYDHRMATCLHMLIRVQVLESIFPDELESAFIRFRILFLC